MQTVLKNDIMKTYEDLIKLQTFKERFDYLRLDGSVGIETFGFDRYLNQALYTSPEWRKIRRLVLLRDNGYDLGCEDVPILGKIIIHHMNPITESDIINRNPDIMDPRYLISVSTKTHNAIHYSEDLDTPFELVTRKPNDTCPWR